MLILLIFPYNHMTRGFSKCHLPLSLQFYVLQAMWKKKKKKRRKCILFFQHLHLSGYKFYIHCMNSFSFQFFLQLWLLVLQ